jgi:hypothetical protein
MKLTRLSGLLAAVMTVSSIGAAFAGGAFQDWPIVGGAAYCALFAGDGVTCSANVPAGPTIMTGNEVIPADTKLPNGSSPQTVLLSPAAMGVGPYQYVAPLTGASVTILPTSRRLMIDPAGTIAALTVVTPTAAQLVDNQTIGLCSTQVITTLTVTAGSGVTVNGAPTATTLPATTGGASCVEWVYRQSNKTLYRVQ